MGVPEGVAELLPGLLVGCKKWKKGLICLFFLESKNLQVQLLT